MTIDLRPRHRRGHRRPRLDRARPCLLVAALIFYLLVRPPRHVRAAPQGQRRGELPPRETDPAEAEELWRLVDRME